MPHDILPVVSGNNLRKIWQKLLATFPTRTQVITLIEENAKLKKEVVQELPTENINTNCIYLVPDPNGTARNVYNEYMYIIDEQTQQGNWELIGTTRVDMTQYYTKTQTDRMLLDKQNRTDNDLPTESKTITGAISEIFTTLSNFISSTGTALTSLINRVTKLEPIQGTTADIMQRFNDGEIPEGYYAESWDDDVTEFAIPITSEQYEALTEAQKTNFNYLITDGLPGGMLLIDNYPRAGSNNAVKSKGLYEKFEEIDEQLSDTEYTVTMHSNVQDYRNVLPRFYKRDGVFHIHCNGLALTGNSYIIVQGIYPMFSVAGNPLGLTNGVENKYGMCIGADVANYSLKLCNISLIYLNSDDKTYICGSDIPEWYTFDIEVPQ